MTPHDTIVFARSIADRTDAEVIEHVARLQPLKSNALSVDRIARDRILHDLARRLREHTAGDDTAISTMLGDKPILTIDVHPGPDPATMAAIRRVRSFQHQADQDGYGR